MWPTPWEKGLIHILWHSNVSYYLNKFGNFTFSHPWKTRWFSVSFTSSKYQRKNWKVKNYIFSIYPLSNCMALLVWRERQSPQNSRARYSLIWDSLVRSTFKFHLEGSLMITWTPKKSRQTKDLSMYVGFQEKYTVVVSPGIEIPALLSSSVTKWLYKKPGFSGNFVTLRFSLEVTVSILPSPMVDLSDMRWDLHILSAEVQFLFLNTQCCCHSVLWHTGSHLNSVSLLLLTPSFVCSGRG